MFGSSVQPPGAPAIPPHRHSSSRIVRSGHGVRSSGHNSTIGAQAIAVDTQPVSQCSSPSDERDTPLRPITRRMVGCTLGAGLTWLLAGQTARAFNQTQPYMGLDLLPTESLPDVYYPEEFLGVWDVESVLTDVTTPMGEDMVPDMQVVERARREDLGKLTQYKVAFLKNNANKVIADRRFNTAQLMEFYFKDFKFGNRINWDPESPDQLTLLIPGQQQVLTRVLRRGQSDTGPNRFEASEFFQQVFERGTNPPKLKSSQCFTKYRWRDVREAGTGPVMVATQVVADFVGQSDSNARVFGAMGPTRPVVLYTYRMAFRKPSPTLA